MNAAAQDPLTEVGEKMVDRLVDSYGRKATMRILAKKSGFVDVPPTIDEFITDSHYLGGCFDMYDKWQGAMRQVYPNPFFSPYLEVALTGAIGLGKTTVALTGTMYDMCRIQYLESPSEYFQLAKTTKIGFALINANIQLAKGVLGDQLDEFTQLSPYFKALRDEAQTQRNKPYLPKNVYVIQGSRFTHVLGQAVVGAILSELNFQTSVKDQAYDNYTNALTRLQSRFQACFQRTGSYPGRIWLDSSKNDANSFVETHLANNIDNPLLKLYDYPFWEVHRERMNYCGKNFKVFIGDQTRDPFIIENVRETIGLPEELTIDVPVEHEDRFRQNLPRSLRDIAGRGTWSTSKLISSIERLVAAMQRPNPVTLDEIPLDFFNEHQKIIDYLQYEDLVDDGRPRFIHIDLGLKTDRTGIACTRLDGFVDKYHLDPKTLQQIHVKEPMYCTEFVIALKCVPGQEVPIWKIREFIILLRERGLPIACVSTDGYQSTNLRQDLTRADFVCKLLSVDRTKDPYEYYRDCVLEGRWDGPMHPILDDEVRGLVDVGKKYDHPMDGSKDVADAVCGSVFSAFEGLDEFRAADQMEDYFDVLDRLQEGGSLYNAIASHKMNR